MPHRNQPIFDMGWMAWGEGAATCENPYPRHSEEHGPWLDGWIAAEEDWKEQGMLRDAADADDFGDWQCHQRRGE